MILDINGNEILNPDLNNGYLKDDVITIHHDAIEGVEEVKHMEVIAVYPNGGKDIQEVIDVEGVEPQDAYDEEVTIQRYVEYTVEELKLRAQAVALNVLQMGESSLSDEEKLHIILNNVIVKVNDKDVTDDNTYPVKLGYKLVYSYDAQNRVIIGKYEKDPNAIGVESNPIQWFEGVAMIDNAFYMKDGVHYVCMSGDLVEF